MRWRTTSSDTEQLDEQAPTEPTEELDPRRPKAKGRPTPKRREAQRQRTVLPAPKTKREAYKRQRDDNRRRRVERQTGLARGDDRYLPARDRGPVRAYVRDLVDTRRSPLSYFLALAVLMLFVTFIPNPGVRSTAFAVYIVALLVMALDGVVLARQVRKRVQERFPDETRPRVGFYAVQRATQFRRMRMPKPRVGIGDKV